MTNSSPLIYLIDLHLPFFLYSFPIFLMFLLIYTFMLTPFHPLILIIMLILYCTLLIIILSMWTYNFILSIMLFLIVISGFLIMLMYFSSLISNEQNKFNLFSLNKIFDLIIFLYSMNLIKKKINLISPKNSTNESLYLKNINIEKLSNIMEMYSYPYNNMTFFCMLFLLITLLLIIKICSSKTSPLRKI